MGSVTFTIMVVPHKKQLPKDKNITELQNTLVTVLLSHLETWIPI